MNLNIITAASNSVGKAILEKLANPQDLSLGLSRRGCKLQYVQDIKVRDLSDIEKTKEDLSKVLQSINPSKIERIRLFHNCGFVIAEIPDSYKNTASISNQKLRLEDRNGDGIDDRTYESLLSTFRNVFDIISNKFPKKPLSIMGICSLIDKKESIPPIFQSMIKTNHIFRKELQTLVAEHSNIHGVIVSASTVKTDTEEKFRKFCTEKEYRLDPETLANALVSEVEACSNDYKDIDLYKTHPRYDEIYKNESNDDFTKRIMKEIGLM